MKLKKEKMPSKRYVVKEKQKIKKGNKKLVDVKIINNSASKNNVEKAGNNIIEELYKEKIHKEKPKFVINAEEDDGIGNLERKLCFQYECVEDVNEIEEKEQKENTQKKEEKNVDNNLEKVNEEKKIENTENKNEEEIIENAENKNNEEHVETENVKKEKKKLSENIFVQEIIKMYKLFFAHPEDIGKSISTWFDSNKKIAFLTALIVGIITHITFLTEMIMSQDGLWNSICYYQGGIWEEQLGRWGLVIVNIIVNNLALPNLVGIVSIILIAISTVFIVDILKLKNKITIFIVSVAIVVSPSLTGTLLYVYASVAYCLAMLLSVLIVKLIFKEKYKIFNFILAIVLFTLSLGIYQSYIGVTIGLTVIRLIKDLFDKNIKIKYFFIHLILMCIIVIIGGLSYSYITEYVLQYEHLDKAEYCGMNGITVESVINSLDKSIPRAYNEFIEFYFGDNIITNSNYLRQEFYKLMFASAIILEIILIISLKLWKSPLRLLLIIFMNLVLPIAFNAIIILAPEANIYILTLAQLILIIPFALVIYEMSGKKGTCIFKWIAIISMFLIVFTYYLADNTSYASLKLSYNQIYSTSIRMMDRIEQTEGYSPEKPIMIAGIIDHNGPQFYRSSDIYLYTLGSIFDLPAFHTTYEGMEANWTNFFADFLGMKIIFTDETTYKNVVNSEEFKEMEIFPAQNSCREIYGTMVIKLSDKPPMP